jgi:hypothetical protein
LDQNPALALVQSVIEQTQQDPDQFAGILRANRIPHLSYSQVTAVESCQYRFYLEYVALVSLDPVPLYFTKGKLLHQIIASAYRQTALGQPVELDEYNALIDRQLPEAHRRHLRNAVQVHFDQRLPDVRVVSIEKPFAMSIAPDLPPCVGVIDLVLERPGACILIDHKTGHDFYPEDELQMAIYVEYMQRQYGEVACEFYYDHYRWVNNLSRIRKPPFLRKQIALPPTYWQSTLGLPRIRSAYQLMQQIKNGKKPDRYGECFRCPYRSHCQ